MSKPKFIVVDIESTGSDWKKDQLHGVGICWDGKNADYALLPDLQDSRHKLLEVLADSNIAKVGHNTRFDIRFIKAAGIEVNGPIHDTMLMAKMLNEHGPLGLKQLTDLYKIGDLSQKNALDELLTDLKLKHVGELCKLDLKTGGFANIIGKYCEEDCRNTYELFTLLSKKLSELDSKLRKRFGVEKTPLNTYKEELAPMEPILIDMEMRGVALDYDYQKELGKKLLATSRELEPKLNRACKSEITVIEERMVEKKRETLKTDEAKARYFPGSHRHTTFAWSAPAQVADLVYKGLKIPPVMWQKTEKGRLSVGSKVRPRVMLDIGPKHRAFEVLKDYQKLSEAKRSYKLFVEGDTEASLSTVAHNGRVHGEFMQYPDTGRLSHRNPNMGNLPRGGDIKRLFKADEGKVFWYFDYSQIEFRILAHLSKDPKMIEACQGDPHQMTADLCGVDRATAKCVNGHSLVSTEEGLKRMHSIGSGGEGFNPAYYDKVELGGSLIPLKQAYYDGKKEQYLVITDKGVIAGTGVHRAMTQRGLVPLKELTDSDCVEHTPMTIPRNHIVKNIKLSNNHYLRLDSNYAYFAGLFVGDGSASSSAANICTGHYGKYIEWREEVSRAVTAVGYKGTVTSTESKVVYVGSRRVLSELNKAGLVKECLTKKDLQIPLWVMEGGDEVRKQFLAGLIDTDGSVTKRGSVEICSKAWELIQDLCVLATDMQLPFYISPSYNKTYKKWYYKFCISSTYTGFLKPYLRCKWKLERLHEKPYKEPLKRTGKVKLVIPVGKHDSYDLEVDTDDHLYSVNGFTTHNTINFAFLYGAYPKKAQNIFLVQAGQWKSVEECEELRERFFEGYKMLMPWLVTRKKAVCKYGFAITPTGYMRRFPEVFETDDKWELMASERKGVNLLGQGFAASIMKRAMIELFNQGYSMISQVHDSAMGMLDTGSDLEYHTSRIQKIAENAYPLRVPLVAEVKLLNSFDEGDVYQWHNTQVKKI